MTLAVVSLYLHPHLKKKPLIDAHHTSWSSPASDSRDNVLADWLIDDNLALLNSGHPTYLSSTGAFTHIDLTITSAYLVPTLGKSLQTALTFLFWFISDFPVILPFLVLHDSFCPSLIGLSLEISYHCLLLTVMASASQAIPLSDTSVKPFSCKGWWTPSRSLILNGKPMLLPVINVTVAIIICR